MSHLNRRRALGLIGAAGASAAVACSKASSTPLELSAPGSSNKEQVVNAVLNVSPLGFPWRTPDPFLFCVHHDDRYPAGTEQMGPERSLLAGRDIGQDFGRKDGWSMYHGDVIPGFPQHPHRGFETVTVVCNGLLDHADSMGATARYGGGDVQWLTAGNGILHSEMFPLLKRQEANPLELFQIWLNLPREDKRATPHFKMLWRDAIPRHVARDAAGRTTEVAVIAGRMGTLTPPAPPPKSWASRPDSEVAIWTVKLAPGASWTLPAASAGLNRWLYFFRGSSLRAGGREIPGSNVIELRSDASVVLESGGDEIELLLLQGRPINEPVVQHGPFVMNTAEEIREAFYDYQRTQFGGWPWPTSAPVHGREERFARHADGQLERPA